MSKFDLRDISQRLASSRDSEAVVFEFLGYLQSARTDWRASLSFYEVSRDSLVNVYQRQGERLVRHDVSVSLDRLPQRLVRKFFHSRARSNAPANASLLSNLFGGGGAHYEPDKLERPALAALMPGVEAASCVCLPLVDREDLVALLILSGAKKGAFRGQALVDIEAVRNMASMALAQHLYHAARKAGVEEVASARATALDFQSKIQQLNAETTARAEENRIKAEQVESLHRELEALDRNSSQYKQELERVKSQLLALEEQSSLAADQLQETQLEVSTAMNRVAELKSTQGFIKEILQVLAQEYDRDAFPRTAVTWFCEHFQIDRCSLMHYDEPRRTLSIDTQRGIDPAVAASVQMRLGQGISGWVAEHRKPLFVRVREELEPVPRVRQEVYNSDSFISVPLVFDDRLFGVLNLSNKRGGVPFTETDLDRATLMGSVLAMILGGRPISKRSATAAKALTTH